MHDVKEYIKNVKRNGYPYILTMMCTTGLSEEYVQEIRRASNDESYLQQILKQLGYHKLWYWCFYDYIILLRNDFVIYHKHPNSFRYVKGNTLCTVTNWKEIKYKLQDYFWYPLSDPFTFWIFRYTKYKEKITNRKECEKRKQIMNDRYKNGTVQKIFPEPTLRMH